MRRSFRTFISLLLLCMILTQIVIVTPSRAATITKLKKTLYVGETFVFKPVTYSNTFKSVKTSNKSIATVKKNSKKKITITAKKKGKAVITIKTKHNITYKYTITVKNKDSKWKAYTPYNVLDEATSRYTSYVMFKITNTSGVFTSSALVSYELYGESGEVVSSGDITLNNLLQNSNVHFFGTASNLTEKVKTGKIKSISLDQDDNAPKYKYTNRNDQINIKEISKDSISVKLMITNLSSENISGTGDVIFYKDEACKYPIGMQTINLYTNAKGSNTMSIATVSGYKSYKIFKRAYTSEYIG